MGLPTFGAAILPMASSYSTIVHEVWRMQEHTEREPAGAAAKELLGDRIHEENNHRDNDHWVNEHRENELGRTQEQRAHQRVHHRCPHHTKHPNTRNGIAPSPIKDATSSMEAFSSNSQTNHSILRLSSSINGLPPPLLFNYDDGCCPVIEVRGAFRGP